MVIAAIAFWSMSQGARSFGARSAADRFDAALAYARALAANSGNGATLVFDQRRSADGSALPGFVLTIYSGRPTASGALSNAPAAPIESIADVREAKLGAVPFTIFLNSAGHASGTAGAVNVSTVIANDPGCPSGETSVVLTFSDPRSSATRAIACNSVSDGVPVAIGTVAPQAASSPSPSVTPTPSPTPPPTPTLAPAPTPTPAPLPTPTPTPTRSPTPAPTPTVTAVPAATPASVSSTYTAKCFGPGDGTGACSFTVPTGGGTSVGSYTVAVAQIDVSQAPTSAATAISYATSVLTSSDTSVAQCPGANQNCGALKPSFYLVPPGQNSDSRGWLPAGASGSYYAGSAPAGVWTLVLFDGLAADNPSTECHESVTGKYANCVERGNFTASLSQL